MQLFVMLIFAVVLGMLVWSLYRLIAAGSKSRQQVRTLTVRVALSLSLFVVLYVAWYFALVEANTAQ